MCFAHQSEGVRRSVSLFSLNWFHMFMSDTKALHITLLTSCRAGMSHYSVSVSFYSLKINIAFLYSPDGGADTKLAPEAKPFISRPSSIIGPNHTKHWDLIMVCNSNYFCMGRHHPHWPLMHIQSFCCLRGIETVSGQTRASQVTSSRRVSGYEDINPCSCSMNLGSWIMQYLDHLYRRFHGSFLILILSKSIWFVYF